MDIANTLRSYDGKRVAPFRAVAEAAQGMPGQAIPELLDLAASEEPELQVGATWVIKCLAERGVVLRGPQTGVLLQLLGRRIAPDATLHVLQTLPFIEVAATDEPALKRVGCLLEEGAGMVKSNKRPGRSRTGLAAHGLLAVAIAGLAAACGGDADRRVTAQVDTIGGVVVVRNGTGQWRASEQWQVVEDFKVGGAEWGENPEQELSYSTNTSVTLGPSGQIFVLEYSTNRVTVFSGEGGFVRTFGRAGEGPGEFRGPVAMGWDGMDRLWVAEGLSGRYHVFDATGAFQKTVPRAINALRSLQHPLVWEAAGTLVEESGDDEAVLYLRMDTLGNLVDTAAAIPTPEYPRALRDVRISRGWESLRFVSRHYIPLPRWSLAPDGTTWSAVSGQLRLAQTAQGGDTIRIVETSHRPAEFDDADRAVIAEGLREGGISRDDIELVRPVVGAIHVMDDGHILVGIVEKVGEASSTFDVFDPEGFFLGTVDLGFRMHSRNIPAIVGDTIVAVTPDDLDRPYLVRATIQRSR